MANSLVSIQIIPKLEDNSQTYNFVDAAIAVIKEAGIKFEVSSLETTMEGELSELFAVIQKMNEKMVALGSDSVISQVKILYMPKGIELGTLTEKYR